jgi:hypothetical protein
VHASSPDLSGGAQTGERAAIHRPAHETPWCTAAGYHVGMNALDLVGPNWELVPLRIPGGWAVRHNGLDARRLADGRLDANDSEDLLWLVKLPPPDGAAYRPGAQSPWREIHLDAGFYRTEYRVVLLDPDWDHILASFSTADLAELVACIEKWLQHAPLGDLSPP